MALALHAHAWASQRGGRIQGLHIDHGLRPESAAEAEIVVARLARRGMPCSILRWEGEKPVSGIQESAREARYQLLGEWCRRNGCLHLLTAHHMDDQVETHLIRKRAGSGPDGLAGMSAVRQLEGVRLLRPLLGIPRARLAAFLVAAGQEFLTDPSNRNPVFARARLRRNLPDRSAADAIREIRACAIQRIANEQELAAALGRCVALHPGGAAVIEAPAFAALTPATADRVLAAVVSCVGAGHYPPRTQRVRRLRAALLEHPRRARTLAGCRLMPWRGRVLVVRELAAAAAPLRLEPGVSELWDRRFAVRLDIDAPGAVTVDYLRGSRIPAAFAPAIDLPRLVWPFLPAIFDAAELTAIPHLGYRRPGAGTPPCLTFRPANPLTRGGFTVV